MQILFRSNSAAAGEGDFMTKVKASISMFLVCELMASSSSEAAKKIYGADAAIHLCDEIFKSTDNIDSEKVKKLFPYAWLLPTDKKSKFTKLAEPGLSSLASGAPPKKKMKNGSDGKSIVSAIFSQHK